MDFKEFIKEKINGIRADKIKQLNNAMYSYDDDNNEYIYNNTVDTIHYICICNKIDDESILTILQKSSYRFNDDFIKYDREKNIFKSFKKEDIVNNINIDMMVDCMLLDTSTVLNLDSYEIAEFSIYNKIFNDEYNENKKTK